MIIKPSIAHRLAELTEEALKDTNDEVILPLLAKVYTKIRSQVFDGKNFAYYEHANVDDNVIKELKQILKMQGFKVKRGSTRHITKIKWKKSWIVSIMKQHTENE